MKTRPRRSVFLLAAELQHTKMTQSLQPFNIFDIQWNEGYLAYVSSYSCDNLAEAARRIRGERDCPEHRLYQRYFMPNVRRESMAWWPLKKGKWDHESRILALLFAAEMLRR